MAAVVVDPTADKTVLNVYQHAIRRVRDAVVGRRTAEYEYGPTKTSHRITTLFNSRPSLTRVLLARRYTRQLQLLGKQRSTALLLVLLACVARVCDRHERQDAAAATLRAARSLWPTDRAVRNDVLLSFNPFIAILIDDVRSLTR